MKKSVIRRILFVITSAICWYFSVGYSHELYIAVIKKLSKLYSDQPSGSFLIDGTDFSPFAKIMVGASNGVIHLMGVGLFWVYLIITAIAAALFITLLRFVCIKKDDIIDEKEIKVYVKGKNKSIIKKFQ